MTRGWLLLVTLMPCACHGVAVKQRSHVSRQGTIREASGVPTGPGVVVTVTDLTSRRVSFSKTRVAGQFEFSLPPGHYAFAVASATGFAFLDEVIGSEAPMITLSSDCHYVNGRLTRELVLPATVNFARVSKNTGDTFAVPVMPDGSYSACLPEGSYASRVTGAMVSRSVPITIPSSAPIALVAYPESRIQH